MKSTNVKIKKINYIKGKSDSELIGNIGFGHPVQVDKNARKKVLITGAGSYIGRSFIEYSSKHYPSLDIDEIDMIEDAWSKQSFSGYDIVYHVAGIAHVDVGKVDNETKKKYYKVNTDLAISVCKKAKSEGVKTFIFMSSMIVYGDSAPYRQKKVIDAHTVPKAANFYGNSKLQADAAIRDFADHNFKVIVLRPPMIYGKGSKGNYHTLAEIATKIPLFPLVNNERSMIHIDNFCEFLCQIIQIKEFHYSSVVLFPQNSEFVSTSNMVKEISKVHGRNVLLIKGPVRILMIPLSIIPGKISRLLNKAFGNFVYEKTISHYDGIDYQIITFKKSIKKTEEG